mgnify:CR=1 FL=1
MGRFSVPVSLNLRACRMLLSKSFTWYLNYNVLCILIIMFLAICTPASSVSAVMVESYKKFIMLSLIVNRCEPTPLPKFVSPVVPRYIKVG